MVFFLLRRRAFPTPPAHMHTCGGSVLLLSFFSLVLFPCFWFLFAPFVFFFLFCGDFAAGGLMVIVCLYPVVYDNSV